MSKLKGFVSIMTWNGEPYESDIFKSRKQAIGQCWNWKDDLWDSKDRNRAGFLILDLSTKKVKRLPGWKTRYSERLYHKVRDKLDTILLKKNIPSFTRKADKIEEQIEKELGYESTDTHWIKEVNS